MHPSHFLAGLVMVAAIAPPTAQAALVERHETHAAVEVCQASMPIHDGKIRKRPRAVQNEGTTTAFVTCGLEGRGGYRSTVPNAKTVIVKLINEGSPTTQTVNCTAIDVMNDSITATSSHLVPPHAPQIIEFASTQINPATGWWLIPAVSCALPPGIGISMIGYGFVEDNGV
jgi:hypothetical protein